MSETKHQILTQRYSTFGDKLLQHTDVLYEIQYARRLKPITIQLAPCEICESDCNFCSLAARPLKSYLPFFQIEKLLTDFRVLGAKSVEITGGGNPLLYRDRIEKKTINDIIQCAGKMGYDVGLITNSHNLRPFLHPDVFDALTWVRISLIQLDEGREPEDYDFGDFPEHKLGFSYIIYEPITDAQGRMVADDLSRTGRIYSGTTEATIHRIARLLDLHPQVKFVRLAGNCLIKGNNAVVADRYRAVIDAVDHYGKCFLKDIGEADDPYDAGCYVGAIRPYIAPHPQGGKYQVYICTSHVLNSRTYDLRYSLGSIDDVGAIWQRMNRSYQEHGYPYAIKDNQGTNWCDSCTFCYYRNNNRLLHTVATVMPDRNFP